ncbi:hypothetical protein IV203_035208 [Nitzschia inconspicua]|uniref:Uncharacterized protein n=1 Tax=Nitzschia inconspicua TaxID=303405 RepID=A0A9K3LD21_9STRA|nr:hypothetical protein IV203_035208 [Nitzschia inconspicua]
MATRKRIIPVAATDFQKMPANHNIGPRKSTAMVEGVKYCENWVLPNMSQAKATKVMINQDEDKFTQNQKKTCDAFHKKVLQGRTNTSEHVLQMAEMVLDQSELNEDEIRICNKLVTARWKSPQRRTATASMKSMDEGQYSVGFKSQDKFMSMTSEDLFLYFEALMKKNKLSILNYNIEHVVEKAVPVMEMHHENAVGMTQEMHNCSADFSFVGPGDETLDTTKPVGSHELLNPLYKELTQLCDVAGKDKAAKTARDLETLIIALTVKEEIASEQSPPTGKVVSCMVSKVSRKRKHVKQFKY